MNLSGSEMEIEKVGDLKNAERAAALKVADLAFNLIVQEEMATETRERMKAALSVLSGIRKDLDKAQNKLAGPF